MIAFGNKEHTKSETRLEVTITQKNSLPMTSRGRVKKQLPFLQRGVHNASQDPSNSTRRQNKTKHGKNPSEHPQGPIKRNVSTSKPVEIRDFPLAPT